MKNLFALLITALGLTLTQTSIAQTAQTAQTTPTTLHSFNQAENCTFLDHNGNDPIKVFLDLYMADREFGLIVFRGHAIEGKSSADDSSLFNAQTSDTSITLRPLKETEATLLDFGGPKDSPADAYLNAPRKANTLLTYKSYDQRGNPVSFELKGECGFLIGTESIGAHN